MRLSTLILCLTMLVGSAVPVVALNPGTDILVPAAARVPVPAQGGDWVTDLFVLNPGDAAVNGSIYWLVRAQANLDPISVSFSLQPGETMVMSDVLREDFGFNQAAGAFRVVADTEVVVNSRIYFSTGDQTFGQGFEGVPAEAATASGTTSDIVGLSHVNQVFRTNFYALAGAEGASLTLNLYDPDGILAATGTLDLAAYEPYLKKINQALPSGDFNEGTLRVTVTAGSAVVGASKVDEASGDPTTLESSIPLGVTASIDGTYEFTLTDGEGFSSGGDIVISDGIVQEINGTYLHWDKDNDGEADCPLVFQWGLGFPATPVGEMTDGVSFTNDYTSMGSGEMAWTVKFDLSDGMTLSGEVTADGSEFPSSADPAVDESGCNGLFPRMLLKGGKVD